jgi:chorismate mutase/prephenate dehydratase
VVYRPEREAQVLRRLSEKNPGPLSAQAVAHLFTEVISACRAQEEMLAVACLGPRGTFSEEALGKHFGAQVPRVMCASIDDVFRSVESGSVGYGVVPVENSTEGGVGRSMDLLLVTPLRVCGEIALPVHQNLLSKQDRQENIRRVYSHAQSLAQCNVWLSQHLSDVERIPVASNAEAARRAAADTDAAAIASRAAAEHYGLSILASSIEDDPNNTTRFVVIGSQDVPESGKDKTSFVMASQNRPGAIFDLLEPLARHRVSMTRLESRPSRTGLWEYVFFVDIEGHEKNATVSSALSEIRDRAGFLKILGSYPVAVA